MKTERTLNLLSAIALRAHVYKIRYITEKRDLVVPFSMTDIVAWSESEVADCFSAFKDRAHSEY